jgi:TolB protein
LKLLNRLTRPTGAIVALVWAIMGQAQITIEIDRGYDNPKRIAVVPFGLSATLQGVEDVADIVSFDLARSGQFAPLEAHNMLSHPTQPNEVYFRDWRILKVEYLLIGRTQLEYSGQVTISYTLYDVFNERALLKEQLSAPPSAIRDQAHVVADAVYEKLTGVRGAFSTKILYVLANDVATSNPRFRLQLADADGARPRTLLDSKEPILSATWAPDGKQVAYVSFERGKPSIYSQDLESGARQLITDFPGLNSAPVYSPDGRQMALVLSRDGNPEIYLFDIAARQLRRVTRHHAIDTEPSWTPDGSGLVFTSDRGGKPQIYRIDLASGLTERITFEGDYNARPRLLPDGKHMVFVHRRQGLFHVALLELEKDRLRILTETNLDESPSIAPNGSMLIYATQAQGQGILAVVSIDGRVKYRLPSSAGDVREPAWSPFMNTAPGGTSGKSGP